MNVIGKGPGNNIRIYSYFHVTVNANGTGTVFFDHFRSDCK